MFIIPERLNVQKIKVIDIILLNTEQSVNFLIRIHEFDTQGFINDPDF